MQLVGTDEARKHADRRAERRREAERDAREMLRNGGVRHCLAVIIDQRNRVARAIPL